MNILILCDKYLPVSEQFIYNQINSLKGNRLFLFCRKSISRDLYDNHFEKEYVWYEKLAFRIAFKLSRRSEYPASVRKKLLAFINEHKIDLVYVHYGTTAANYAGALQKCNKPVICAFHGFDASRKLTDNDYRSVLLDLSPAIRFLTAPSRYLGNKLTEAGIPADKIRIIPYGADIEKIDKISHSPDTSSNKIRLIHAGRLVAKKGVPDLVRVFSELIKKYQQAELIIVGGGDEENEVKELVNKYNLSQSVLMTGPVSHKELIRYMKAADIFILNSRVTSNGETEGLPNSIMEAFACRLAVVSTYHSGIPEMITDRINGLLVPPSDNEQLLAALSELMEDARLRSRLSENGYQTVIESFSYKAMADKIVSLVNATDT